MLQSTAVGMYNNAGKAHARPKPEQGTRFFTGEATPILTLRPFQQLARHLQADPSVRASDKRYTPGVAIASVRSLRRRKRYTLVRRRCTGTR